MNTNKRFLSLLLATLMLGLGLQETYLFGMNPSTNTNNNTPTPTTTTFYGEKEESSIKPFLGSSLLALAGLTIAATSPSDNRGFIWAGLFGGMAYNCLAGYMYPHYKVYTKDKSTNSNCNVDAGQENQLSITYKDHTDIDRFNTTANVVINNKNRRARWNMLAPAACVAGLGIIGTSSAISKILGYATTCLNDRIISDPILLYTFFLSTGVWAGVNSASHQANRMHTDKNFTSVKEMDLHYEKIALLMKKDLSPQELMNKIENLDSSNPQ